MGSASYLNPYFANVEENAEIAVRKFLSQSEWDGTVPVNLLYLCEVNDYGPDFEERLEMEEEGTTEITSFGSRIIINTHGKSNKSGLSEEVTIRRRQRFTLAHEIGHCFYRSHTDYELQSELRDEKNPHRKSYERKRESQANGFAANLLIPTNHFKNFLRGKSYKELEFLIQEISDIYDVSFEVAIQRLAAMTDFPCIAIIFQDGYAKRIPAFSKDFGETGLFFGRGDAIPKTTSADRLYKGVASKRYEKTTYKGTSIWFPSKPWLSEKFKVIEHSFHMGEGRVISFLEVESLEEEW